MAVLPGKQIDSPHSSPEVEEPSVSNATAVSTKLPGAVLKQSREQQNIELEYAAEHLNLSPGKVKALEADDYRSLPNATFVKGYIRSYARFLKIPSQDLIQGYEIYTGCNQPKPVVPVQAPRSKPKGAVYMLAGGIGLVLIILAVVLLWPKGEQDSVQTELAKEVAGATDTNNMANEVAIQSSPEAAIEPADSAVAPLDDDPQALEYVGAPNSNDAEPSVTAVDQAETSIDADQPVVEIAQGVVEMAFTGDCWVEIRDADNALIYADLKRLGDALRVAGKPPLDIKIGNGNMVSLAYNGEPVKFRIPSHNVVRIRLGE